MAPLRELPDFVDGKTRELLDEYAALADAAAGRPNLGLVRKLSEVLQTNDESRRTLHFSLLLEAMRADDAPAIAEMFYDLQLRGLGFDPEANFFAQRWGELDPGSALAYVVENGKFERGGILLQRVMTGWASKNPNEAALWIMEQENGPLRDVGIEGAATGWGRTEPDGATAFLLALPEGGARDGAVRTVFWQVLYGRGIETAVSWYDALPEAEVSLRQSVFSELSKRQLQRGDPEAEAWVMERASVMTP